ncbi:MAG: asparagine synthase (glutamine-hydrolyzing) [Planctomycetaceae bacterium]|nr:asparagine synthase (glutamine-hydrolyzing) [Planctomycetaceae bacterium]
MCGIVGIWERDGRRPVGEADIRCMLGAVRHRGPDEFGVYLHHRGGSSMGLGSARLSIVDLVGGQQPISNESGDLWIVFNGEIYNHLELRRTLEAAGHRFATNSDTEVVIHLFEQYGPEAVSQLNGQFAFAIWDERRQRLVLARDRVGIRPLYYCQQDGGIAFASEIKALLASRRVRAELHPTALDEVFSVWSPLPPHTAFRNIASLPPGHYAVMEPGQPERVVRYWDFEFPARGGETLVRLEEACEQLRELLADAVRLRLRADVPVGAYLSGGLDSSTIAALVQDGSPRCLQTFSIAFEDAAFDERAFQAEMARWLGTRHHLIACTAAEIGAAFPAVVWHAETPILRTSPVPLFLLSRLVRDNRLKVVLTGEGADETLAGYNIFKEAKVRRFWARQPGSARRPLLLTRLYPYISSLAGANRACLQQFFGQDFEQVDDPCYSHRLRWTNTSRTRRLFSADLQARIAEAGRSESAIAGERPPLSLPDDFSRWSPLAQAQYLEAKLFLAEYLLCSQGDRMAMANSVEGRFPFLDHRVIQLCNQMKPRLKLCGLNEKHVLKRAMRDRLPRGVCQRAKQPYRAPIHACFFPGGKPLEWVAEMLDPRALDAAGCFDAAAVGKLVHKLQRRGELSETEQMALAGVLSTQLIQQQFVVDFRPPAPIDGRDRVKVVLRGDGHTRAAEAGLPHWQSVATTPIGSDQS